jgi:predicted nucleic acid-binding protein
MLLARLATETIHADEPIRQLAHTFEPHGVKPRDALHLACAVSGHADYFLTCDDRLLKKRRIPRLTPLILLNPIDFIIHHGGQ